jgi:hypothetical protein
MDCTRVPEECKHCVVHRFHSANGLPGCAQEGLSGCQINCDIKGENQEKDTDEKEMYFMLSEKFSRIHCLTLPNHHLDPALAKFACEATFVQAQGLFVARTLSSDGR